jgi:cytochrome P450
MTANELIPITLPTDGTPLMPSQLFNQLQNKSPMVALQYSDGHVGWLVLEKKVAQNILMDSRFSQLPQRFPGQNSTFHVENPVDESDSAAMKSADLLSLDGDQHRKCRKAITGKFSFKVVESYRPAISIIVEKHLTLFSEPISIENHAYVLGIPEFLIQDFENTFVKISTRQQKVEYVRQVYDYKINNLGEDVISHMINGGLTKSEIEGLIFVLFSSGRDSIAYMISTSMVALLQNPSELNKLKTGSTIPMDVVDELMRYCAMFITLFPRTALEDVHIGNQIIKKGVSVSISPVAINRDENIWENPDELKLDRIPENNLSFGYGIHGCLGQGLARLVIQEALTQLINKLPNISLVDAEQLLPMEFAHPVATYQAGKVLVNWEE